MKRIFVLAAILTVAFATANAQEGKWYIGTTGIGTTGVGTEGAFMTGFYTKGSNTVWGIAPEIGYNASDRVSVGLGLGYTSFDDDNDIFGANPYVRWHACKVNNFAFYLQGDFKFLLANTTTALGDVETKTFGISIIPGVAYTFNEHFSINAGFGELGYWKTTNDDGVFGLNVASHALQFGLSYTF